MPLAVTTIVIIPEPVQVSVMLDSLWGVVIARKLCMLKRWFHIKLPGGNPRIFFKFLLRKTILNKKFSACIFFIFKIFSISAATAAPQSNYTHRILACNCLELENMDICKDLFDGSKYVASFCFCHRLSMFWICMTDLGVSYKIWQHTHYSKVRHKFPT